MIAVKKNAYDIGVYCGYMFLRVKIAIATYIIIPITDPKAGSEALSSIYCVLSSSIISPFLLLKNLSSSL